MNWSRFARVTPVAGIAALSLGAALAVSACGAAGSGTAAGTGLTRTVTSATATAPASAPAAAAASAAAAGRTATSGPTAHAPADGATTAGAGAPASAPATAPSSAPAPAPGSVTATPISVDGPFVLLDCLNRPQVRPASYMLACADGNDELIRIHWTNWVPPGAAGLGIQYLNDCTPNCASGHFHSYPVDIAVSGAYRATARGPFAYTKITLTYPGPRPTVYVTVHGKVVATHPGTWSQELPPYVAR